MTDDLSVNKTAKFNELYALFPATREKVQEIPIN